MKHKRDDSFHNLLEYYESERDSHKRMMLLLAPVLTVLAAVICILWPQYWWIAAMLVFLDICLVIGWLNAKRAVKREKERMAISEETLKITEKKDENKQSDS